MLADRVRMVLQSGDNLPGSSELIAGNESAGFFGEVLATELFTGEEIANEVGLTSGILMNNDTNWLKFSLDGKIIYRPKVSIRKALSWLHLSNASLIYGDKTIEKDGVSYKVRLMKTALVDPAPCFQGSCLHYSEWNRLIIPLSDRKHWWEFSPHEANVETDYEDWGINYTDAELNLTGGHGSYVHMQEKFSGANVYLMRGTETIAGVQNAPRTYMANQAGWCPILEVIK